MLWTVCVMIFMAGDPLRFLGSGYPPRQMLTSRKGGQHSFHGNSEILNLDQVAVRKMSCNLPNWEAWHVISCFFISGCFLIAILGLDILPYWPAGWTPGHQERELMTLSAATFPLRRSWIVLSKVGFSKSGNSFSQMKKQSSVTMKKWWNKITRNTCRKTCFNSETRCTSQLHNMSCDTQVNVRPLTTKARCNSSSFPKKKLVRSWGLWSTSCTARGGSETQHPTHSAKLQRSNGKGSCGVAKTSDRPNCRMFDRGWRCLFHDHKRFFFDDFDGLKMNGLQVMA